MATNSCLTFVNKVEAQRTYQTFKILIRINLILNINTLTLCTSGCLLILIVRWLFLWNYVFSKVLSFGHEFFIFHKFSQKFELLVSLNHCFTAVFVLSHDRIFKFICWWLLFLRTACLSSNICSFCPLCFWLLGLLVCPISDIKCKWVLMRLFD